MTHFQAGQTLLKKNISKELNTNVNYFVAQFVDIMFVSDKSMNRY